MKNFILIAFALIVSNEMISQAALRVASNGRIGMGVQTPSADLHLKGTNSSSFRMAGNNTYAQLNVFDGGGTQQNAQLNFDLFPGNNSAGVNLGFFRSTNTSSTVGFRVFRGNNTGVSNAFVAGNGDTFFAAENGEVGIGTNSPSNTVKLHVVGDAGKTTGGDLWTILSDKRLKKNIKSYKEGLDLLMKINPVSYQYTGEAGTKANENQIGVIAQEVEKVAPYMVRSFVHETKEVNEYDDLITVNSEEYMAVNMSSLKYILVNAIKEQQEMIESLQDQVKGLTELLENDSQNIIPIELNGSIESRIGQNHPNPYNDFTTIEYDLASNIQGGKMNIFNINGQLMKSVALQSGSGKVVISSDDLPAGTYTYNLEVDGKIISNKKMVKMR